jgi:broad specificity phosphatase PhoE
MPLIYLIRHATPDWSRTDIPYFTPPGPPLTAQGEAEAAQLGVFLREAGVKHILASPLERCQRTAQIVAEMVNTPFAIDDGLTEWKPGDKDADVKARLWPVWERAQAFSAQVGPIALITHGGPIAALLGELGVDKLVIDHHRKLFDRNNPLPPAGAWQATRLNGSERWSLSLAFVPEAYRAKLMA